MTGRYGWRERTILPRGISGTSSLPAIIYGGDDELPDDVDPKDVAEKQCRQRWRSLRLPIVLLQRTVRTVELVTVIR
jgi:hypothetical protein